MLFRLEEDTGSLVNLWIAPDNPSLEPSIYAVVGGRERHLIRANLNRADVMAQGVHRTGQCGFLVDAEICPGLTADVDVEFFDAGSNLMVFRRARPHHLPVRLFHLETQANPIYSLYQHLCHRIQMSYGFAEFIGEDTIRMIFHIQSSDSIFMSGALSYRRYEPIMRANAFKRTILLSDPYRELASRLVQLKALARAGGAEGGWKGLGRPGLIAEFAEVDIRDPGALARAMRNLSPESFTLLANPTMRQIVANTAEESIDDHMVAVALGMLAEFDVIGFDDDLETFVWQLEALIGAEGMPRQAADTPPDLEATLAAVKACRPVQELIRLDLALFDLARQAAERAERPDAAGALGTAAG